MTVTVRRHERGLGLVLSETHKVERIEEWSDAHGTLRAGDQPLAILHRTLALALALALALTLARALALALALPLPRRPVHLDRRHAGRG